MCLVKVTPAEEKNASVIEFSVDAKTFADAVEATYKKEIVKMNIPGFRKGHAPRGVVEKMYGKGVFYEGAINAVLPEAYSAAAKESALDIVGQPEFDVVSVDENGLVMTAKVYTRPEVTLRNYKGLAVDKIVKPVTDADVEEEIARVQRRNARTIDISDRAAKLEDTVNIDYDGYADGKQFDGGKAEKQDLKLGSGQFIPGFEDQIVGHSVGDAFDVNVTFPTEYHAKELAGKDATFKVVLHGIKYDELPALDDEFAKDVSDFDTFDAYKADVKAKLEERNNKLADNTVEEKLIDLLIADDNFEADIPAVMVDTETENMLRDYDNNLRMQGLDLKTYFQYTGMDLSTMREQMKPQALRQVKVRLALEKIAALESIQASEEEIDEEIGKLATAYHMEKDDVKKAITPDMLAQDITVQKAVKLVKEQAVVTEKTEDPKAEEAGQTESASTNAQE